MSLAVSIKFVYFSWISAVNERDYLLSLSMISRML